MNAGELITMAPPKFIHNRVVRRVNKAIESFLDKSNIGEAYAEAGYVLSRDPLTIREPDVSFLSYERINKTDPDDYVERAPELAIEVVSPSDSAEDLETKVEQYFRAGAQQVWVLYPKTKRVHVFCDADQAVVLDETQTLGGEMFCPVSPSR